MVLRLVSCLSLGVMCVLCLWLSTTFRLCPSKVFHWVFAFVLFTLVVTCTVSICVDLYVVSMLSRVHTA